MQEMRTSNRYGILIKIRYLLCRGTGLDWGGCGTGHPLFFDDTEIGSARRIKKETAKSAISHLLIGVTGFEPATSRPPAERATKLRHTP